MGTKFLMSQQAAAGPGKWIPIDPSKKRTIQVVITGAATVSIEGSNDGANPVTLEHGILASKGYTDDDPWTYIRANLTDYTSGTVSVVMGEK